MVQFCRKAVTGVIIAAISGAGGYAAEADNARLFL